MTTIKLKNGSGAPTAGDLAQGEPALDLTNKRLYTEDSGGTVIEVGTNPGTDVTFADNRKAIFGAGSDLQIYHDGSASYIVDNGTGNLRLQGVVQVADDPSSNDGRILFGDDGSAKGIIHYDYSLGDFLFENTWADSNGEFKFTANSVNALTVSDAGIDVTGTVNADGLTVDGNDSYTSNVRFTYGTSFPTYFADWGYKSNSDGNKVFLTITDGGSANDVLVANYDGSVGIGTDSPSSYNSNSNNLVVAGSGNTGVTIAAGTSDDTNIFFSDGTSGDAQYRGIIRYSHSDDAFQFHTAGANERMRLDASGNVQQATSVNGDLYHHIYNANTGTSTEATLYISNGPAVSSGLFAGTTGTAFTTVGGFVQDGAHIGAGAASAGGLSIMTRANAPIRFYTNGHTNERMRIDASGNVGIGTSDPSSGTSTYYDDLVIRNDASGTGAGITIQSNTTNGFGAVEFRKADGTQVGKIYASSAGGQLAFETSGSERMRIDSSGNVDLYQGNNLTWRYAAGSTIRGSMSIDSADNITFSNTSSNTERMRIGSTGIIYVNGDGIGGRISGDGSGALVLQDGNGRQSFKILSPVSGSAQAMTLDASGNLLVGTTTYNSANQGILLGATGVIYSTGTSGISASFGRNTTDGSIVNFRKDNSTVGSIGTETSNSDLYIGNGDTAIMFHDGVDAIFPHNASTNASRDAAIDIGYSTYRFKDLYLSGTAKLNFINHSETIYPTSDAAVDIGTSSERYRNLYLSGGAYLGGTGAANKLDDYEEGTFTPTLSSGFSSAPTSYNTREGRYTKIGRYVYFEIDIFPQGATADSSSINIDDLPFTSTSSSPFGGAVVTYQTGFNTNAGDTLHIGGNDDDILIADTSGNGRAGNASGVNINQRIIISGWYTAA